MHGLRAGHAFTPLRETPVDGFYQLGNQRLHPATQQPDTFALPLSVAETTGEDCVVVVIEKLV